MIVAGIEFELTGMETVKYCIASLKYMHGINIARQGKREIIYPEKLRKSLLEDLAAYELFLSMGEDFCKYYFESNGKSKTRLKPREYALLVKKEKEKEHK